MDKYLELKEKFEANRDDENAVKMAAYMRNLFSFYGLSTPKRKAIVSYRITCNNGNQRTLINP